MYLAHRAKQMLEESRQHRKMLVRFPNTDITSLGTEVSGSHGHITCLTVVGWHTAYKHFLAMTLTLKIHLKLGVNSRTNGWEKWKWFYPS